MHTRSHAHDVTPLSITPPAHSETKLKKIRQVEITFSQWIMIQAVLSVRKQLMEQLPEERYKV